MAQTQAVAKQLEQDMEQWKADTAAHNQKVSDESLDGWMV